MLIEAVILTGGASSRMGSDKASIPIDGVPMAARIACALLGVGIPVTNLGGHSLEGCRFVPDETSFAGPLVALSRFMPSRDLVFVASCDLPLFDVRIVHVLADLISDNDAAVPVVGDRAQPLCALYRGSAFARIPVVIESGRKSMTAWLNQLKFVSIEEAVWVERGISPTSICGVNTLEELARVASLTRLESSLQE